MLDAMRRRAQGWVAGFIVAILTLAFALWGIQYYITAHGGGEVVAKVDGTSITSYQVNKIYAQLRQRMMAELGDNFPSDPAFQKILRRKALQTLINRTVITQEAHRSGYRVADDQVIAEIRNNPGFQVDGQFSPARLQQVLRALNYSQEELFSDFRDSIIVGQIQAGIQYTAFALPSETEQAVKLSEQERTFKYLTILVIKFIAGEKVSDQQAKAFYQKYKKNNYMDPLKVRVDYIELTLKDFHNKIKPTDAQLKEYYKDNERFFSTPRQWHLTHFKIHLLIQQCDQQHLVCLI